MPLDDNRPRRVLIPADLRKPTSGLPPRRHRWAPLVIMCGGWFITGLCAGVVGWRLTQ